MKCNVRIANSYGWKDHSDVLLHNIWRIEVRKVQNLSEVNILTATQLVKRKFVKVQKLNFLTYFSGIVPHMTHQVIVPIWALRNCDVRKTNSYNWTAHIDVLPPNFWAIEVRRVNKLSEVNILSATQVVKTKFLKVQKSVFSLFCEKRVGMWHII